MNISRGTCLWGLKNTRNTGAASLLPASPGSSTCCIIKALSPPIDMVTAEPACSRNSLITLQVKYSIIHTNSVGRAKCTASPLGTLALQPAFEKRKVTTRNRRYD